MTFLLGPLELWLFWRCGERFLWRMRGSVADPADQEAVHGCSCSWGDSGGMSRDTDAICGPLEDDTSFSGQSPGTGLTGRRRVNRR